MADEEEDKEAKTSEDKETNEDSSNEEQNTQSSTSPQRNAEVEKVQYVHTVTIQQAARRRLASIINIDVKNETTEDTMSKPETENQDEGDSNNSVISDKGIVDAVFDDIVSGTFDLETKYTMKDMVSSMMILELLDKVSTPLKLEVLGLFHAMLKKSVDNLRICSQIRLISELQRRIMSIEDDAVADKMIELIGILAMYSITVKELKCFFSALKGTDGGHWPPHALKLLDILKRMPEKHGPDVYFNFSGIGGSAIALPPLSRWPHQPGFTFSTWLQLDAAHLSSVEQSMRPFLYSFTNGKGVGYSAHFSGPMLVVEVHGKSGKTQTLLIKHEFRPQIWHHIVVVHCYNRFKSSEIHCFVNGQLVTSGEVNFPTSRDPMDKCFIGGSHLHDPKNVFKGQMAAIYLMSEPLQQSTIAAVYRLGPGYKGKFKFESEFDIPMFDIDRKVLYDGKLSASVVFTYNPKAVDNQLCIESSPVENQYYFISSPHAIMLEGVQAVVTHSLQAALHSFGGIQMLFPLFAQLDFPLHGETAPNPKVCALLLGLIYDLLRGSAKCQQQFVQNQGFMVIGYLLERSSATHLTEETMDLLLGLARYLMSTPSVPGLLGSLLDNILLNPILWIKTPLQLQANLLSLFATGHVGGLDYAGYTRKEVGVPRLMLMLRRYYSLTPNCSSIKDATKEEIISLRAFLLLLIKQMIVKDGGVQQDELRSILVYLALEEEEENYPDVLHLLLSTMCEMPQAIIPCFDSIEGFQIFFKLLVCNNENVRIYCLKILGCYVKHLTLQRKAELVENYGFISMIASKLSIFHFSLSTYNALFEILTAQVSKHILTTRHPEPDSTYAIYHPTVLPVIVSLINNNKQRLKETSTSPATTPVDSPAKSPGVTPSTPSSLDDLYSDDADTTVITRVFLSDLVLLLNHSKENRRLMLQIMCWQDWLFSLAFFEPRCKEEVRITDTVFSLVKMLLHYAIQSEKEGWRVWVDTLAIMHAKVSEYLLFKEKEGGNGDGQETLKHVYHEQDIDTTRKLSSDLVTPGESTLTEKSSTEPAKHKPSLLEQASNVTIPDGYADGVDHHSYLNGDKDDQVSAEQKESSEGGEVSSEDKTEVSSEDKAVFDTPEKTEIASEDKVDSPKRKESADMDYRKKFFYALLQGNSAAVVTSLDSLKRSCSENDVSASKAGDVEKETVHRTQSGDIDGGPRRPSSAEPTVENISEEQSAVAGKESSEAAPVEEKQTQPVLSSSSEDKVESTGKDVSEEIQSKADASAAKVLRRIASDDGGSSQPKTHLLGTKSQSLDLELRGNMHSTPIDAADPSPEESKEADETDIEKQENASVPKCRPYIDIPEFNWSLLHQRLLSELLFAVEADLQVWRTHTRKSIADFLNSRDCATYIMNLCHMVSVLSDSLIYCCGGLLPLLSSATSKNFVNDVLEPCGGMTLDTSFSFLNRVMNLVDVIAFASSVSFAAVETHRTMTAGGVLRQCIRLVFCSAARNRVVCRQRERPKALGGSHKHIHPKSLKETQEAIRTLIASTKPPTGEDIVQNIPGHMTTITNPDRLLQDIDLQRLRSLVYRDVEDTRQSQFVALVVIYFIAVLMVARYRDILENDDLSTKDRRRSTTDEDHRDGTVSPRSRAATWAGPRQADTSSPKAAATQVEKKPARVSKEPLVDNTVLTPPQAAEVVLPLPERKLTLEEKIEVTFRTSAALLRELLFDFSHYLSRTLVGSHGQDLISEGLGAFKSEDSAVELTMLLCSQEWQNSLQRTAGTAFMELVNEGRLLSHSTRERIVMTASEAKDIMRERDEMDRFRHAQFETQCTKTQLSYLEEFRMYDQLLRAKRKRNVTASSKMLGKTLDTLTSGFGAWPVEHERDMIHFLKLDNWEDRLKRRFRFIRNAVGSTHPEATLDANDAESAPSAYPSAMVKYHLFKKKTPPGGPEKSPVELDTEGLEDEVTGLEIQEEAHKDIAEIDVVFTSSCVLISPGITVTGTMAITTSCVYFTADEDDEKLKKTDQKLLTYFDCLSIKFWFENVTAVCSRRYLLQNHALEIFLRDRKSFMFSFNNRDTVKRVVRLLPSVGIGPRYGLPRTRAVSLATPKQLFAKSDMLQRWQLREVSNFEYLMFLNFIAGRTYNDLNQYLVFPWILSDYTSETLDLTEASSFRDLTKAVVNRLGHRSGYIAIKGVHSHNDASYCGAYSSSIMTEGGHDDIYLNFDDRQYVAINVGVKTPAPLERSNHFVWLSLWKRYNSWDKNDDIPPFHYGTHYSTAGFVLNWLVRVEPFATLFLSLQSGKFDHPSRTFSSLQRAWENCQRDTSDVKELIPELFYLPEMFINKNRFVFGEDDDGTVINNVALPPWAKTPEEFIRIHREAIESDYVSNNLHRWVDLIFGYRQRGVEAEHAANVFYYLTYEGSVDLDSITDQVTRQAIEQQIKSFGQTPSELLTSAHLPRNHLESKMSPDDKGPHKSIFLTFAVTPDIPVVVASAFTQPKNSFPALVTVSTNQIFSVNRWINNAGIITSFQSLKNVQIEQDPILESNARNRRQLSELLDESVHVSNGTFVVTSDNRFLFACGYWDNSFKCFSTDSGKLIQCVFGHWDVVTCLAYSDDAVSGNSATIVSGSRDATVLVWNWDAKRHHITGTDEIAASYASPLAICTGHEMPILCVDVNLDVGVIASGSYDIPCLLHSLSGELLRCLNLTALHRTPSFLKISNSGHVVVISEGEENHLCMFSLNGQQAKDALVQDRLTGATFTTDGYFFVTGGDGKSFQIWRTHDLVQLSVFPPCDGQINSLALTPDDKCLVSGLANGSVMAIAMDFTMWPRS